MYKLVILVEPQDDAAQFDARWPRFLAEVERMPGLRREVTSRVDRMLHGSYPVQLIHELYFDSLAAVAEAMGSLQGEKAGQVLQEISGGKVTLLFADHLQDDLAHIRSYQPAADEDAPPGNKA